MSELMIPSLTGSLTGTRLVMRAYSVMTELISPSLTGTKTCCLFSIIRRSRPYILCINESVLARAEIASSLTAFQGFVL